MATITPGHDDEVLNRPLFDGTYDRIGKAQHLMVGKSSDDFSCFKRCRSGAR